MKKVKVVPCTVAVRHFYHVTVEVDADASHEQIKEAAKKQLLSEMEVNAETPDPDLEVEESDLLDVSYRLGDISYEDRMTDEERLVYDKWLQYVSDGKCFQYTVTIVKSRHEGYAPTENFFPGDEREHFKNHKNFDGTTLESHLYTFGSNWGYREVHEATADELDFLVENYDAVLSLELQYEVK